MSVYIPSVLQRQLRERFANCCAYCHTAESLTVTTFELEHIVPRSAGGVTAFENLCLSCPSCNRHKASRQTAVDPETQAATPLFHPQQQRWSDHFVWNADATEVVGLTPTGRATIAALQMNRPQMTRVRKLWVKLGEHPP
ncbi:HNH endonuclease [Leptolyngbya sp. BL0902]|uniref:HNH endonuclease n=1 Tax=Leptolyngbya sp. BL0902 TaxID=1115757 RepID=UPI0018E73C81|nr:HNH endonuclease signature motif containing protein [Leptolyngbya sp. BL0902]